MTTDRLSSDQIVVRTAHDEDAAQISELGAHVFATTFGHTVTPEQLQHYLDESYSLAAVADDISNPSKDMVVATGVDGRIVGFALLTRGTSEPCIQHLAKTIELQRLYVDLDHHGRGIGKLLTSQVEDVARSQSFEYIWLGVWEENHKARGAYEKMGYRMVGDHIFDLGGDLQTDHIMVKKL